MKWMIALALLWPSLALAQVGSGPSPTPSGLTSPSPTGAPHSCDQSLYPLAALKTGAMGKVGLHFQIGADGVPKNITVSSTSNNADLDQAAVACVALWKYNPALKNSVPVEISWNANVDWALRGRPHSCDHYYPRTLVNSGIEGTVKLSFTILDDGYVSDIAVARSSGRTRFDDAAVDCAKHWRYHPALQNGQPIAVEWNTNIVFAFKPVPPPTEQIEQVVVFPNQ